MVSKGAMEAGVRKRCPHGKLKRDCAACNGCPHGKRKRAACAACKSRNARGETSTRGEGIPIATELADEP